MIRLKSPLSYRGTIIDTGATVGFLPVEMQQKLIENGVAEKINPEKKESGKPVEKMTKDELLKLAASLEIEGNLEEMTKAEILAAIEEKQKPKE